MAAVSSVEKELVKITKVKADKYEERQDFLAAILKAMEKLSDDEFDNLSDEAAEWHTKKAVPAFVKKKDIPDFVEAEAEAEEDVAEPAADDAAVETVEDDESDPTDDNPEDDAEAESENEAAEAEEDAKATKKKGKTKPAAKAKPEKSKSKAKAESDEDAEAERPAKAKPQNQRHYAELSGDRDKFGITKGTKTSDAVAMYERGCTAAEITEELGGRYYNILAKLAKDGHKVENQAGKWVVTHKDEVSAKSDKKKGK